MASISRSVRSLQWGRVVIDAERNLACKYVDKTAALQWGRVVIDAERITLLLGLSPGGFGFNGAAS